MQPCPVCGNTGVDANGYCTTCSTYLGVPQQGGYPAQPGYPQEPQYGAAYPGQPVAPASGPAATTPYPAYPPSSSVPYSSAPANSPGYGQPSAPPAYTPGYASGPASAPPAGYGPASAPPGFSGPGYGYPTGAPEPPKKSYTGAIVAASVGLVVLIAAIVVVLVVKSNKSSPDAKPTSHPSATGSAKPSASSAVNANGIDTCTVGDWKVVSEQITVDFPDYNDVDLTLSNSSFKVTLNADGTAEEDYEAYGDQTDYLGTSNGHTFQLSFNGTLTYDFTTKDGTLSATHSITNGEFEKWIDHKSLGNKTNKFDDYDWEYTCSGSTMTRTLSNDTQRLTRL
jgi:hypothetical protein